MECRWRKCIAVPPGIAFMRLPTATYRLQFRNGMTFDKAAELVPHLTRLGISHLYASPIFAATRGSTHGYDVIDPNLVDPSLGGMEGLIRLSDRLRANGLGLILDIVPNHLAASVENPWWHDVLQYGRQSRYAGYFDNDWERKLTLPILTGPIEAELADGAGKLVMGENGRAAFDYRGTQYPLLPASQDAARAAIGGTPEATLSVLGEQAWELVPWQAASNGLSYRRFFEITGLVGVRVEEAPVFDAVHATVLDLVRQGRVDGLRIDHIDGLADPEAYLKRLRAAVGPDIYIVVEKILEGSEDLPRSWPVQGTTGYEFIDALADVFVSPGIGRFRQAWAAMNPDDADAHAGLRRAKELMADVNFRGEVQGLQRLFRQLAQDEQAGIGEEALDAAVRDVLIAFPVYRTYGSPRNLPDESARVLRKIFDGLHCETPPERRPALDFVRAVLEEKVSSQHLHRALRVRTRMQHLTGPLLAKSLEDTFFYRYNSFIALNEVGGDPLAQGRSPDDFHRKMRHRQEIAPHALSATSTHDTKRGEDARARLYALSEAPDVWLAAIECWKQVLHPFKTSLPSGPVPDAHTEWLIFQALAGVLPVDFDPHDEAGVSDLKQRFTSYLEKVLREAKLYSNWNGPDLAYEQAVKDYAANMLDGRAAGFLDDFCNVLTPFIDAGLCNSLNQTVLKLTCPGIPDIYNGSELSDFSLVDPDNRRPLDVNRLSNMPVPDGLSNSRGALRDGRLKLSLIAALLRQRQRLPGLFAEGDYVPLSVSGPRADHVLAFARSHGEHSMVVIATRLLFHVLRDGEIPERFWAETSVHFPENRRGRSYTSVADGRVVTPGPNGLSPVKPLLDNLPFSVLIA
jgi:(1->4)-alpha-D-glucan 1-alpha-D-glucosylmutase